MPVIRSKDILAYFAHIPKCAGSTIEDSLIQTGLKVEMLRRNYYSSPSRFLRTSPQHFVLKQLNELYNEDFFDYSFAVVRCPVARVVSAYNHNSYRMLRFISFDLFLDSLEKSETRFFLRYDNHFVPSASFVPEGAEIFYLEDGIESILSILESRLKIEGKILQTNSNIRKRGIEADITGLRTFATKKIFRPIEIEEITRQQYEKIRKIYFADYEQFHHSDWFKI